MTLHSRLWHLGATANADRLDFQYSTNATSLINGTYTDVNALDLTTPNSSGTAGARDGNSAEQDRVRADAHHAGGTGRARRRSISSAGYRSPWVPTTASESTTFSSIPTSARSMSTGMA